MILLFLPGFLGLALVAWGLYMLFRSPAPARRGFYLTYPQARVTIGGRTFRAAVADTVATRTQGLSGCDSMAEDEAMLFTFPIAFKCPFHMKGMKFPLDIIWIRSGQVADVSENMPVPPAGAAALSLPVFRPKVRISMALEINAGLARKFDIKAGNKVEIAREIAAGR